MPTIYSILNSSHPGETVIGKQYKVAFGGKGANQAVAAGRGAEIAFIACVGADDIGERVRRQLASDRIDTQPIEAIADSTTGVALIFVNAEGENVIGIDAGANAAVTPDYRRATNKSDRCRRFADAVESPLETVIAAARLAKQYHTQVILNPAPARELPDELLGMIDMITPNETEAQRLTGIAVDNDADVRARAQALHDKGIATVIITLGSRGVWLSENGNGKLVPGFKVQAGIPSPPAIPLTVRWSLPCWKARSWPTRCVSPMRRRLSP